MEHPVQLNFALERRESRVLAAQNEADVVVAMANLLLQIVDSEEEEEMDDESRP